jgi:hypothetical protein
MTMDPVFRKSAGGDVDGVHQLARYVNGADQCSTSDAGLPPPVDPCRFTTCGAGGECFLVDAPEGGTADSIAACACVPGATARMTYDPAGVPTVVCQDLRMSFLNPGDRGADGTVLPDPCAGFDCGMGRCESVNLTPTCVCDRGAVAVGSVADDGTRRTTCQPPQAGTVPVAFYSRRLPDLPSTLPGGREVDTPASDHGSKSSGGLCTVSAVRSPAGDRAVEWVGLAMAAVAAGLRRRKAQS